MNSGEYSGLHIARLLVDVNKYKPGIPDFSIPTIMNEDGLLQVQTIQNNTANVINQAATGNGSATSTITKSIKIAIPIEIMYFYPAKIIPKGTIFFVMFVGGDINKPVIVGRDNNGYTASAPNNNG